jgi:hypothetical protein
VAQEHPVKEIMAVLVCILLHHMVAAVVEVLAVQDQMEQVVQAVMAE